MRAIVPPDIPGIISAAPIAKPLTKIIDRFSEMAMRLLLSAKVQIEHLLL